MKKFYLALFLLTFAFKLSYGSHASGADLTYDYLGNGQYRIVLKFYRDCSGISAPTSPIIDINSASCGVSTSLTLTQQSFQEVTPLCPTATSTCNGGSTPGCNNISIQALLHFSNAPIGYLVLQNAVETLPLPTQQHPIVTIYM